MADTSPTPAVDAAPAPSAPTSSLPSSSAATASTSASPSAPTASALLEPPNPSNPSNPKAPAPSLLGWALAQPAAVDTFLLRLNKCMETPVGIDAVLGAVCYGARLASVLLSSASAGRALLHAPARQLATLVRLPDSTLVLLTGQAAAVGKNAGAASGRAAVAATRLRALGSLMTEARMILRLWGLLSMYVWARLMVRQLLAGADRAKSVTARLIGWTQLLSCIAYQVYENGAYLGQRGVLGWSPAKQARAYRWSSRAFSVYVAVELARLVHDTAVAHRRPATSADDGDEKAAEKAAAQAAKTADLHKDLARYVSLAPVMAHWSVEKGFLSDAWQTLLGCVPAGLQMHKTWKETQL